MTQLGLEPTWQVQRADFGQHGEEHGTHMDTERGSTEPGRGKERERERDGSLTFSPGNRLRVKIFCVLDLKAFSLHDFIMAVYVP